jgi:uncharacterized RDD family membrane protein YckC
MIRWRNTKKKNNKKVYTAKETLSVEYAGFWIRFLAIMMDTFMIITPIGVIIGIVFGYETLKDPDNNVWAGVIQILLYSIVTLSMWYKFDQTPGKKALHLYIVNAKTFKKPSLFMYIIHFIGYFLAMISIIGFLIGIFRKDKRALHDLLSGTCVIIKER